MSSLRTPSRPAGGGCRRFRTELQAVQRWPRNETLKRVRGRPVHAHDQTAALQRGGRQSGQRSKTRRSAYLQLTSRVSSKARSQDLLESQQVAGDTTQTSSLGGCARFPALQGGKGDTTRAVWLGVSAEPTAGQVAINWGLAQATCGRKRHQTITAPVNHPQQLALPAPTAPTMTVLGTERIDGWKGGG